MIMDGTYRSEDDHVKFFFFRNRCRSRGIFSFNFIYVEYVVSKERSLVVDIPLGIVSKRLRDDSTLRIAIIDVLMARTLQF